MLRGPGLARPPKPRGAAAEGQRRPLQARSARGEGAGGRAGGQPGPGAAATRARAVGVSRGLGQDSPRGEAHSMPLGSAGVTSPLPLAASMVAFRSCIHLSFSSRVLGGRRRLGAGWRPPTPALGTLLCRPCVTPLHHSVGAAGNAAGGPAYIPLGAAGVRVGAAPPCRTGVSTG